MFFNKSTDEVKEKEYTPVSSTKEKVDGSTIVLGEGKGKVVLNTYVSKEDCAPAKGIEKFIKNALNLAQGTENSKPWIISEFKKDEVIDECINSIDSVGSFSDGIKPSGITNVVKKKKVGMR